MAKELLKSWPILVAFFFLVILFHGSLQAGSMHGYVWITNTNDGTISKVRQSDGVEVARYLTGPRKTAYPADEAQDPTFWSAVGKSFGLDPSRTAFDKEGNCWVLNIAFPRPNDPIPGNVAGIPSVTKFAWNPTGNTSNSGGDVKPWGTDNAMLAHFSIPSVNSGGRGLTLDKSGYVWVGVYNNGGSGCPDWDGTPGGVGRVFKLNPSTGAVLAQFETHSVYGMATAPSGLVYLISRTCGTIEEINPGSGSCGGGGSARVTRQKLLGDGYRPYAIAIDAAGIIWMNAFKSLQPNRLYRYDPLTDAMSYTVVPNSTISDPNYFNKGSITIDQGGFVWFVNSISATLSKFRPTNPPTFLNNFDLNAVNPPAYQPVGCAISDANDSVVVTFKNGTGGYNPSPGYWVKVHRTLGGLSPLHTLPKSVPSVGNNIYSRGDLTGWDPQRINRPPVALCRNVTVPAGSNCQASASIDNGSYDPDCDDVTITQSPPGPYGVGITTVTLTITDQFGVSDQCQGVVTVVDNTPPILSCPANITRNTSPGTCGTNVSFSITSTDNCPGVQVSATPPSGSFFPVGNTNVSVIASDASGNHSSCSFTVTVTNGAPALTVPSNDSIFQCTPTQVCLPFNASDPDNNLAGVSIISGPGSLVGNNWCYTPSSDGVAQVTLRATDACNLQVSKSFRIAFDINSPPQLTGPSDDSIFQCVPTEVCLPFSANDEDGNLTTVTILSGPGALVGNTWCYTPTEDMVVEVTLQATDACNAKTNASFRLVFDLNTSPVVVVPPDDSIFQCVPTEVCRAVGISDEDGNLESASVIAGPGALIGGEWCYTPLGDESHIVTIQAIDTCGFMTEDSFRVVFDINSPPVLVVPARDSFFQCRAEQVCLPYSATDEDGNLFSVEITGGPGSLANGNWCFTPDNDEVVSVTIRATDSCGEYIEQTFEQEFDLNQFPQVSCPVDTTLHWGDLYASFATAIDSDLVTYHAEHITFSLGQISPDAADIDPITGAIIWQTTDEVVCNHTLEVIATDQCGDADSCYVQICVQNSPPIITCPADTLRFIYGDTVVGTVSAADSDSGPYPLTYSIVNFSGPGSIQLDPVSGFFSWITDTTQEFTCDFELQVSVTDSASICNPCSPENADTCSVFIRVVSEAIIIEKVHGQLQGQIAEVGISMLPGWYCNYPFGGFDFLVSYDNSALTLLGSDMGEFLSYCAWEYFTYRTGADGNCGSGCPSGLVRITALAETNDGPHHPSCYATSQDSPTRLATLRFLVSNDRTLECQYVPIRFFWYDCGDNTLSSVGGDTLMISRDVFDYVGANGFDTYARVTNPPAAFPTNTGAPSDCERPGVPGKPQPWRLVDYYNGGVDIICAEDIDDRGDINLDGLAYTIADAVVFTNYFIYGTSALGTGLQVEAATAASDVNGDGLALTVADLVYLIRVVVGDAVPLPKAEPLSLHYRLTSDGELSVDGSIGAVYLIVEEQISPMLLAKDMELGYSFRDGQTHILVYSHESGRSCSGPVVDIGNATLTYLEMASADGLTVTSTADNPIPENFALVQNYPNPFNPVTEIRFALPEPVRVKLTVFNSIGQEVAVLVNENLPAGEHARTWDASKVASGIYLYRLEAGTFVDSKKMILIK